MVLDDKYMSFHLFVVLPKSYVTFALGIKFELTKVPTDKLLTDAFPTTDKVVPTLALPTIVNKFVVLSNVKLALPFATPASLNTT